MTTGSKSEPEPKSFYPRNSNTATVGQIFRHMRCHGTKCCFYCHKKFPYGRTDHVHECWIQWKISRKATNDQ